MGHVLQGAISGCMSGDAGDLADAIAALRSDLESAIREGQGKDVQFGLGEIELTLQLVATKYGGGKIGWSVLGVDAGAQSERTHVVKLTLKPLQRMADGTYTADFAIADRAALDPGIGGNRP
jgi:Trypsin-co-occurring domain 2